MVCNLLKQVHHFGGLMFNINFLGAPGIQPDIVSSYISYRPEDEKNVKNIIVKDEPGFFTKIIDYVPSKSDYISFLMLVVLVVLFFYMKPINNKKNAYNIVTLNTLDLNESYSNLKNIINDINNNNVKLLQISSSNDRMNFKFKSSDGVEILNSFNKQINKKYGFVSRIQGDSVSNYILTTEMPWKVYNDSIGFSKVQNFGQSEYVMFIIEDLIKQKKLHRGNLRVDIKDDGNYFIKFYPSHIDI